MVGWRPRVDGCLGVPDQRVRGVHEDTRRRRGARVSGRGEGLHDACRPRDRNDRRTAAHDVAYAAQAGARACGGCGRHARGTRCRRVTRADRRRARSVLRLQHRRSALPCLRVRCGGPQGLRGRRQVSPRALLPLTARCDEILTSSPNGFGLLALRWFRSYSRRQLLAPSFAVPFFKGLVGNLSLDKKLCELASLRLALEWHELVPHRVGPCVLRRAVSWITFVVVERRGCD